MTNNAKYTSQITTVSRSLVFALFFLTYFPVRALSANTHCAENALPNPVEKSKMKELPLTILPVTEDNGLPMVFFISGDGGWIKTDKAVSKLLNEHGMPVVGLNALKYFWKGKTPDGSAAEFSKIISHYMQHWNRHSFILVGYSFGASVVPFIATRLNEQLKSSLKGVYCFSPEEKGNFKIRLSDFLYRKYGGKYKVLPELKKITRVTPVCAFGKGEDKNIRKHFLPSSGLRIVILPGKHHYDDKFARVANVILNDFQVN
ncbi:virulence factor [Prolixibacter bellariivorans]|uniref:Virulence factor n=1 Tax=Prolixibacter bellariivorans TaxID=314319 RepID=A0A5M4ATX7_9BACT|nr:AcvB/VirJ family lysyl-phosphatidylglycerol hydrolase [Prolixibacter bellariivorans]GET31385.1 virulence factor [Prolixibacter bellariivorans]